MTDTIVICAKEDDVHARKVAGILQEQHGKEVVIFDTSTYPGMVSLTGRFESGAGEMFQLKAGARHIDLQEVTSFWWRRPQPVGVDPRITNPQSRDFAFQECISALFGALECCEALWVNDIYRDIAAEYKPFQLKVARQHGFLIPDTLITNVPEELTEFWNHHKGNVIYKSFNQRAVAWRPTRLLREQDFALLDNLRHAPVIFQPVVSGIRDVRVTIVGETIFASEFDIEKMEEVDHRMQLTEIPCRPHQLPAEIEGKVRAFMSTLELEYGGVDFRITPDGRYVFFEINTAGEFMYLESRTGQPIAQAMAEHLARGKPSRPKRKPV